MNNTIENLEHIRIACNLCNFHIPVKELDMLLSVYELVKDKGGATTMEEVIHIREIVKTRHAEISNNE